MKRLLSYLFVSTFFLFFSPLNSAFAGVVTGDKVISYNATGGDCSSIGMWSYSSKMCIVNSDIQGSITIASDGIFLDGRGHYISGNGSGNGITISGVNRAIVWNFRISNFQNGIYMANTSGNQIEENRISNTQMGFNLALNAVSNHFSANYPSSNWMGFYAGPTSGGNDINNSNLSDNTWGARIDSSGNEMYSVTGERNSTAGLFVTRSGNTIRDTHFNNNAIYGILGQSGGNAYIDNELASNGSNGMQLSGPNDMVRGNTITQNRGYGMFLNLADGTTITQNTISNNSQGIVTQECNDISNCTHQGATITNNTINSNGIGIWFYAGKNNLIQENSMAGNSTAFYLQMSAGNRLVKNTVTTGSSPFAFRNSSDNVVYGNDFTWEWGLPSVTGGVNFFDQPAPVGGNHWSLFDTASEGCFDADVDGFCDSPYVFSGGQDNLPIHPADKTAPVTRAVLNGSGGDNGWYRSSVEASLEASDDDTGVASTQYSLDGTTWNDYTAPLSFSSEGISTLYFRSTDKAGNVEDVVTKQIKIDTIAPEVVLSTPANYGAYILNDSVPAEFTATDAGSGIRSVEPTTEQGSNIDTGSIGLHEFFIRAYDQAGNSFTVGAQYRVEYKFSGFLDPVNPDGSSVFKSGKDKIIPIRFQLTDANGVPQSDATATMSLSQLNDVVSGTVKEESVDGTPSTGEQFEYDASTGSYFYNLGGKEWSKGTYNINVAISDTNAYQVDFSIQ